jgi:hypothetical protein
VDAEVQQALGLIDGPEGAEAERFLTAAVEVAGRSESWEEFADGLRTADVDDRTAQEFLERADRELPDPWDAVRRFSSHQPAELVATLEAQRVGGVAEAGGAEPDYAGFTAFLDRNDSSWQETWPESRAWMEYTAGQEGFVAETTSFLGYVDATTLADALKAYGATPTAASAAAGAPGEEAPSPEQAAADAMALGRRAVQALREQVPDLVVTDEQLIAILDRELRAAAGA